MVPYEVWGSGTVSLASCCRLNSFFPALLDGIVTPTVTVFGARASIRYLKLNVVMTWDPNTIGMVSS